jgi:(5-formylfuran-3-yl)methyl phosphate synthase
MTALLVSVRSAAEALAALAGGAALIDAKEPSRGSLGRADDAAIREIVAAVAGRTPVSAALGEWIEDIGDLPDADLTYVKWGLAGCASRPNWHDALSRLLDRQRRPQVVLTAYADWQCARAPAIEDVFALARSHPGNTMLVDTHCKDAANSLGKQSPTLLDWLPAPWIEELCARCREASVKIALAGSLGPTEIRWLAPAQPDWFAVRGAVCDGDRHGTVQAERVRRLVELLTPRSAS